MKRLFIFLCVLATLTGCVYEISLDKNKNLYVNRWIHDNMSALYYWNDELPAYKSSYANPEIYFETLINKEDRFSAIFSDYKEIINKLNGVTASDVGFEFELFRESSANSNIVGIVVYVKPGTTASIMGIKRGNMFRKINGKQITIDNYSGLINTFYDATTKVAVTFSDFNGNTFVDRSATSITKVLNYKEDPVYLDTVYTIQDKKIGYLVYNFFTTDSGDETMYYDLKMNNTFGAFKQANITDLVIDLRYNSGGMATSAIHLASMLVPNLTANKVLTYTDYNQNYTDYFNSEEFKQQYDVNPFIDNFATAIEVEKPSKHSYPVQNIGDGLQRIYFLTGRSTASASEMVINGLKPYINCVLIGDTTVGKNVGSTLVYDEENTKKNRWAMMPIILKYFNKDHQSDFTNGFVPDYLIQDDYAHSLGDTREALLAKAISQITGVQQAAQRIKRLPITATPFSGVKILNKQRGLVVEKFLNK
ncbi:MAG: S41 family peptidase [Paludibacter sp.]|nr:S41 family peptidase [Paludibacter sp.]